MTIKSFSILLALAVIAGVAIWYKISAGTLPAECQFVVVTSTGSKKLTVDDLKQQLEIVEDPSLEGTPGLKDQAKKLRDCVDKIENKRFGFW